MKRRSSVVCGEGRVSPSVKRTKVLAQRKFAQGSSSYTYSASKIIPKTPESVFPSFQNGQQSSPENEECELNNFSSLPTVDDFLTFLCFRETDVLPERLNYLNTPQFDVLPAKKKPSKSSNTAQSSKSQCREQRKILNKKSKNELKNKKNAEYKLRSRNAAVPGKKIVTKTSRALALKHNQRLRSKTVVKAKICENKLQNLKTKPSALPSKLKPYTVSKPIVKLEKGRPLTRAVNKKEVMNKVEKRELNNSKRVTRRDSLLERLSERASPQPKEIPSKKTVPIKSPTNIGIKPMSVCLHNNQIENLKKPAARSLRVSLPKVKPAVTNSLVSEKFSSASEKSSLASEKSSSASEKSSSKPTTRNTRSASLQVEETAPPPNVSSRPSRRTKEAAALYMEMLGKELLCPEESFDDDDNISIESFPELPNTEQHKRLEKELKEMNQKKILEKSTTRRTSTPKTKAFVKPSENCIPTKFQKNSAKVVKSSESCIQPTKVQKDSAKVVKSSENDVSTKTRKDSAKVIKSSESDVPTKMQKDSAKVVKPERDIPMKMQKDSAKVIKPSENDIPTKIRKDSAKVVKHSESEIPTKIRKDSAKVARPSESDIPAKIRKDSAKVVRPESEIPTKIQKDLAKVVKSSESDSDIPTKIENSSAKVVKSSENDKSTKIRKDSAKAVKSSESDRLTKIQKDLAKVAKPVADIPTKTQKKSAKVKSSKSDSDIPTKIQNDTAKVVKSSENDVSTNIRNDSAQAVKSSESDISTQIQKDSTKVVKPPVSDIPTKIQKDSAKVVKSSDSDSDIPMKIQKDSVNVVKPSESHIPTKIQKNSAKVTKSSESDLPTKTQKDLAKVAKPSDSDIRTKNRKDSTKIISSSESDIPTAIQKQLAKVAKPSESDIPTKNRKDSAKIDSSSETDIATKIQKDLAKVAKPSESDIPTKIQKPLAKVAKPSESDIPTKNRKDLAKVIGSSETDIPTKIQKDLGKVAKPSESDIPMKNRKDTAKVVSSSESDVPTKIQKDSAKVAKSDEPTKPQKDPAKVVKPSESSVPTKIQKDSGKVVKPSESEILTKIQKNSIKVVEPSESDVPTKIQKNSAKIVIPSESCILTKMQKDSGKIISPSESDIPAKIQKDSAKVVKSESDIPTKIQKNSTKVVKSSESDIPAKIQKKSAKVVKPSTSGILTNIQKDSVKIAKSSASDMPTNIQRDSTKVVKPSESDIPAKIQKDSAKVVKHSESGMPTKIQKDSAKVVKVSENDMPMKIQIDSREVDKPSECDIPAEIQKDSAKVVKNSESDMPIKTQKDSAKVAKASENDMPTKIQKDSSKVDQPESCTPMKIQNDSAKTLGQEKAVEESVKVPEQVRPAKDLSKTEDSKTVKDIAKTVEPAESTQGSPKISSSEEKQPFFSRAKTAKNVNKPVIQTVVLSNSKVFSLESKKIFKKNVSPVAAEQEEEISPRKSEAFSADNENSVYAFEPDLPTTSPPFRRLKPVTPPKPIVSNSIAVQVSFENDSNLKCSSSMEAPVSTSDCGGDRVFYIPIQTSTTTSTLGVAVKLDTDGPNQKIIMSATLITNSPTCTTNTTTTVCAKTPDIGTTCTQTETMKLSNKEQAAKKPKNSSTCEDAAKTLTSTESKSEQTSSSSTSSSVKTSKKPTNATKANTQSVRILKINKNKKTAPDSKMKKPPPNPVKSEKPEESAILKPKSRPVMSEPVSSVAVKMKSRPVGAGSTKSEAVKAKSRSTRNKNAKKLVQESQTSTDKLPSIPVGEILEAPTFYPTEKEFNDPLEYIDNIRGVAEKFGLCRIVPPSNFRPECKVADEMRFTAYNQYVHKMLHRWGPNVKEMMAIKKYLATQNITFTHPPWIGGMEVDLPRLYQIVQQCGGLKAVIEKERWQMVADIMKIPKLAQDRITKLDDIYCKYLLPYDILSHDEREKLFEEIEKEWTAHLKNPSEDEVFEDIDECIVKGRTMPLSCFYRIARNTMMTCFGNMEGQEGPSTEKIEEEFWNHVSKRKSHICVHCGSIDSGTYGYGFSTAKNSTFRKHPWNLKELTNNSASILRFLGPVMGITVPTLHVGMLYSACCWYRDPHGLPWIEYLHTGANKIWYGIPDDHSEQFKEAMLLLVPRYCRDKKIWLPSDTVMIPPPLLTSQNISLSRVVQHPGQFIVVFPKAFTSSISTGYLVSESVYFAHAAWLDSAKQVFMDMQDSCEPSVFSLEQLVISIAEDTRPSLPILAKVLPLLLDLKDTEISLRSQLKKLGVTLFEKLNINRKRKSKGVFYGEDNYECEMCHTNLFVSLVVNSHEQCHYCLTHAVSFLSKKPTQVKHCTLMYAHTEEELDELINKVKARIEAKSNKKSHGK